MNRELRIIPALMTAIIAIRAYGAVATLPTITAQSQSAAICDMKSAREWCDAEMLHHIEGIWEYPDDHTRVLVRKTPESDTRYDIVVIDSPDCRLTPGDVIGYLQQSPLQNKYEMAIYRVKVNGIFAEPGKCAAEYNDREDAIVVKSRKVKISLASRWFLPAFWRALRLKHDDPTDKIPQGMVKIYPQRVHRQPDYL
ncbi:MAG: hypothetical protein NC204_00490 [Candidatus Amulumruptor caecigallinarius]|nr:hypothetical protein [Candidatus Amulumruptor caecigallinarius]